MDGLEVQEALKAKGVTLPVVIMTGHGDVSSCGSGDEGWSSRFHRKAIRESGAARRHRTRHGRLNHSAVNREQANEATIKLKLLTPRERDVLDGLAKGSPTSRLPTISALARAPWRSTAPT